MIKKKTTHVFIIKIIEKKTTFIIIIKKKKEDNSSNHNKKEDNSCVHNKEEDNLKCSTDINGSCQAGVGVYINQGYIVNMHQWWRCLHYLPLCVSGCVCLSLHYCALPWNSTPNKCSWLPILTLYSYHY